MILRRRQSAFIKMKNTPFGITKLFFRHPCDSKRPHKFDNFWTFGKANDKHGYMEISSARIHIIVATAFHGPKQMKEYVVDHTANASGFAISL